MFDFLWANFYLVNHPAPCHIFMYWVVPYSFNKASSLKSIRTIFVQSYIDTSPPSTERLSTILNSTTGLTGTHSSGCGKACAPRFRKQAFLSIRLKSSSSNFSLITRANQVWLNIPPRSWINGLHKAAEGGNHQLFALSSLKCFMQGARSNRRYHILINSFDFWLLAWLDLILCRRSYYGLHLHWHYRSQ